MTRGSWAGPAVICVYSSVCVCVRVSPSWGARSGVSSCDSLLMYSTCVMQVILVTQSQQDSMKMSSTGNSFLIVFVCGCVLAALWRHQSHYKDTLWGLVFLLGNELGQKARPVNVNCYIFSCES